VVRKFVTATLKGWGGAIAAPGKRRAQITSNTAQLTLGDHDNWRLLPASRLTATRMRSRVGWLDFGELEAPRKSCWSTPDSEDSGSRRQGLTVEFFEMRGAAGNRPEAPTVPTEPW